MINIYINVYGTYLRVVPLKVYCCWPKDRQAQDGNGNCATPYDSRCVDSDPGDNTDLCFVDHADGAKSTGSKATDGWFTFPFDDGSNQYTAEGPMHCRKCALFCGYTVLRYTILMQLLIF